MDHSSMSMAGSAPASAMSAMTMHFGETETVLFDFWKFSSVGGLILTCFILVLFSVIKEVTRVFRTAIAKSTENNRNCCCRVIDGLLHAVIMTLSYFLMVIFMNLNVWMCITIVAAEVLCHSVSAYISKLTNVNFFEK